MASSLTKLTQPAYLMQFVVFALINTLSLCWCNSMTLLKLLASNKMHACMRMSLNNKQHYICIHKGTEHLKTERTEDLTNTQDMVLSANDTIAYKYPTTTLSLAKSANNADIVFKQMTMYLLTYPNDIITIRAVNRELKELVDENDFKRYYENKVKIIEEKNKEIEEKLSE